MLRASNYPVIKFRKFNEVLKLKTGKAPKGLRYPWQV